MGVATDLPGVVVYLDWAGTNATEKRGGKEDKPVIDTIAAVHYTGKEIGEDQIDMHKEFETVNDNDFDIKRRDNFSISVQCPEHHQEILDTLVELQQMWDVNLSRFHMAKHFIEPTTQYVRHVKSAPYLSGLKTRNFENSQIDKLLARIL